MKEDVHVRIDELTMRDVRAYAERCGFSLATAVAVLLRFGLKASEL